jgi:hypothetical protein
LQKAQAIEMVLRGMVLLTGMIPDKHGIITIYTSAYWRDTYFNILNLRAEKNKFDLKRATLEDFSTFYVAL